MTEIVLVAKVAQTRTKQDRQEKPARASECELPRIYKRDHKRRRVSITERSQTKRAVKDQHLDE